MTEITLKVNTEDELCIENIPTINTHENIKDALLASLYSQVEFLRNEINEKNLLIRTLIIWEADMYQQGSSMNNSS